MSVDAFWQRGDNSSLGPHLAQKVFGNHFLQTQKVCIAWHSGSMMDFWEKTTCHHKKMNNVHTHTHTHTHTHSLTASCPKVVLLRWRWGCEHKWRLYIDELWQHIGHRLYSWELIIWVWGQYAKSNHVCWMCLVRASYPVWADTKFTYLYNCQFFCRYLVKFGKWSWGSVGSLFQSQRALQLLS